VTVAWVAWSATGPARALEAELAPLGIPRAESLLAWSLAMVASGLLLGAVLGLVSARLGHEFAVGLMAAIALALVSNVVFGVPPRQGLVAALFIGGVAGGALESVMARRRRAVRGAQTGRARAA